MTTELISTGAIRPLGTTIPKTTVMPGKTGLITEDKMLIVTESTVIRMWKETTGNATTELIVTTTFDERTEMIDDETSEMMIDDESTETTEITETTETTTEMMTGMTGEEKTETTETGETEMMMLGEKPENLDNSETDVMPNEMMNDDERTETDKVLIVMMNDDEKTATDKTVIAMMV